MELDFSKNIKDSSELQHIIAEQKSRKQINDLPDSVWYLVIIVFTASFGSKVTKSVLDRKKK